MVRVDNPKHLVRLNDLPIARLPSLRPKEQTLLRSWIKHAHSFDEVQESTAGKTIDQWRMTGNDFFNKEQYVKAATAYTRGLEISSHTSSSVSRGFILSNRAQALLEMELHLLAAQDARKAMALLVDIDGENEQAIGKAAFRLVKALTGLSAYVEAKSILQEYINTLPSTMEINRLRMNLDSITSNGSVYKYDLDKLLKQHVAKPNVEFWVPDYAAPGLETATIECKGGIRGVRTTVDIPAGTLLVVNKAVGMSSVSLEFGTSSNAKTNMVLTVTEANCYWKVIQSAMAFGRGADVVKYLSASSEEEEGNEVNLQTGKLKSTGWQTISGTEFDLGKLEVIMNSGSFNRIQTERCKTCRSFWYRLVVQPCMFVLVSRRFDSST
eukprot:GHVR01065301.1.p1 GENE.GHVR01065301.1~~GHVR01065301.1.p1  ORF type:complete len:397 (-),score=19.28 GHVR01065301.1:579-1724(-)